MQTFSRFAAIWIRRRRMKLFMKEKDLLLVIAPFVVFVACLSFVSYSNSDAPGTVRTYSDANCSEISTAGCSYCDAPRCTGLCAGGGSCVSGTVAVERLKPQYNSPFLDACEANHPGMTCTGTLTVVSEKGSPWITCIGTDCTPPTVPSCVDSVNACAAPLGLNGGCKGWLC